MAGANGDEFFMSNLDGHFPSPWLEVEQLTWVLSLFACFFGKKNLKSGETCGKGGGRRGLQRICVKLQVKTLGGGRIGFV